MAHEAMGATYVSPSKLALVFWYLRLAAIGWLIYVHGNWRAAIDCLRKMVSPVLGESYVQHTVYDNFVKIVEIKSIRH